MIRSSDKKTYFKPAEWLGRQRPLKCSTKSPQNKSPKHCQNVAWLFPVLVPTRQLAQPECIVHQLGQQLRLVPDEKHIRVSQEQCAPVDASPATTAADPQRSAAELVLIATSRAHAEQCSVAALASTRAERHDAAAAAATTAASQVNFDALAVVSTHSQFWRWSTPVTW